MKYEKKKHVRVAPVHANENKALHNWQMKMIERKKQQGFISSKILTFCLCFMIKCFVYILFFKNFEDETLKHF